METLGSIRASAACVALVLSHLTCTAAELELPIEDRDSAWFAPTLVTNDQPICAAVLDAERATFFAPDDAGPEIPGLIELTSDHGGDIEDADVEVLDEYPLELMLKLPDRSHAFLYFFGYPGCGGACETEKVGIDDKRIVESQFEQAARESAELPGAVPLTHRYGPDRWRLFKSSNGDFYLRGTLRDHTQWYRVAAADRFELACDIALKPDVSNGKGAVYSQEVSDAIDLLRAAADRMASSGGSCSNHTRAHWADNREKNLEAALYRPWAVVERHLFESDNSGGDYKRIIEQLKLWSLGGVTEYRAFAEYQSQFARTAAIITKFYRTRFGWAQARAAQMADAALKGAISSGFGFYDYDPYAGRGERELRQALLSRAPLDQIRSIVVDPKDIDRGGEDSILNLAIDYPEALSYLLEKGFNPNIGNGFGKTPLMYAAQYNQVAAAEMLLDAGADANAKTNVPAYDCTYSIDSSSWTALHYAARYASARLIRLLRDRGAVSYVQTTGDRGGEYPLDLLQRYAGFGVTEERNPHIAESELVGLAILLAVPSDDERLATATHLFARARWDYTDGDAKQAYQHLCTALLAQPDLPDAVADLPLVALRAGHIGPAISAADRAIKTLKTPAGLAASWFNKGLVCEHPSARETLTSDGARCELDQLEPFIKSWRVQPSTARANKLRTMIQKSVSSCGPTKSGRYYRAELLDADRPFHVYVLHRSGETIDGWQVSWLGSEAVSGRVIDSFSLGQDAVTLLQVPLGSNGPIPAQIKLLIEGKECAPQW